MRKYLIRGAILIWLATILYFLFVPHTQRNGWLDLGVIAISVAVVCLGLALYARELANWRALGLVVLIHALAQLWLQGQWSLWGSAWDSLNAMVALVALDSFVALLGVILLLLFLRDASVWALGIVYVACPLGMIVVMSRYATQPQLGALAMPESLLVVLPAMLVAFLAVFGAVAFFVNLTRLLVREAARRPLRPALQNHVPRHALRHKGNEGEG